MDELMENFEQLMQRTEDFTCLLADMPHLARPVAGVLRAINSAPLRVIGRAYTVQTYGEDLSAVFDALDEAPAGSVLVIDARGNRAAAFTGERVCGQALERGLRGIIIDGCCRDVEGINRLAFPVYARGTYPAPARRLGTGVTGIPVSLAGSVVKPGDLIAADGNGVVVACREQLDLLFEAVGLSVEQGVPARD